MLPFAHGAQVPECRGRMDCRRKIRRLFSVPQPLGTSEDVCINFNYILSYYRRIINLFFKPAYILMRISQKAGASS